MTATWLESTPPGARDEHVEAPAQTILDRMLPVWDARRTEVRVIVAPMQRVYAAALDADMLDAVRQHPVVRVLFAIRRTIERAIAAVRRRPWIEPPPSPTLRVRDIPPTGEWVMLGENPPHEVAFGVIGRFWAGETRWKTIDASEFAAYGAPGVAKIGCHLLLHDPGDGGVLLSYEARTRATDAKARRAFLRYWRFTSPFIGIVMRALLAVIERDATRPEA